MTRRSVRGDSPPVGDQDREHPDSEPDEHRARHGLPGRAHRRRGQAHDGEGCRAGEDFESRVARGVAVVSHLAPQRIESGGTVPPASLPPFERRSDRTPPVFTALIRRRRLY
jgi:hypothetical protein